MPHSLFSVETGQLTGLQMSADAELLALNTPAGCAWVDGAHDARRCAVRLVTDDFGAQLPVVVPRTPPRPADTELQTWRWDDAAADWAAVPTLAMRRLIASEPLLAKFAPLDDALARPLGEIAEAQALGEVPPAAAIGRLRSINAEKKALRARLADIAAASSIEALQQLIDTSISTPAS